MITGIRLTKERPVKMIDIFLGGLPFSERKTEHFWE
jgi:hypothetical protein